VGIGERPVGVVGGAVDEGGAASQLAGLLGQDESEDLEVPGGESQPAGEGQEEGPPRGSPAGHEQGLSGLEVEIDVGEQRGPVRGGAEALAVDRLGGAGRRPGGEAELVHEGLALDVEHREPGVEPARQPPRGGAEDPHERRPEGHAHEERVDRDPDREPERDGLDDALAERHEEREHRDHDQGGCDHHLGGVDEALLDGRGAVAVDPLLPHAGGQEHLVVHGQPEEDAHEDDREERDDGCRLAEVHEVHEPAPVEHEGRGPEGPAHAEQVAERRLDRDEDGAEHQEEEHEGQPDHEDAERQQRVREPVGDVDGRGGVPGDGGPHPVPRLPHGAERAEVLHEAGGGGVIRAGPGDHLNEGGVRVPVGNRERHRRDPREVEDVVADPLDHPERVIGFEDRAGDDEGAVATGAEVLGDEVEGDAVRGTRRVAPRVRQGQLEVTRGQAEGRQPRHDEDHREERDPCHGAHPPAGGGSRPARRARRRGPEPLPGEAQERRQGGQGEGDLDRDGDGGERAHDREERQLGDGEAGEGDDVGGPGEDDGGARGPPCTCRRLLELHPLGQLVPVPRHDQEPVVDADGEGEHEREDHRRGVDGGHARGDDHEEQGRAGAHEREDDGHQGGLERAEDDQQHHEGDDDPGEVQRRHLRHAHREQVPADVHRAPRDRLLERRGLVQEDRALLVREGRDHEAAHPDGEGRGLPVVAHEATSQGSREPDLGDPVDLLDAAGGGLDRRTDRRVQDGAPVRCEDHHRRRALGGFGERHPELVERDLGGRAGDGELVVEGATERQREDAERDQEGRPGGDHPAPGAVAGSCEPVED